SARAGGVVTLVRPLVFVVLLVTGAAYATEPSRPTLAVLDLEVKGADPLKAQAAMVSVVRGIRQLDVFQVLSAEDVRQLLAIERNRMLMGMETGALTAMNQALGARHVITGSLLGVGTDLTLELRLLDTADSKVVAQKTM